MTRANPSSPSAPAHGAAPDPAPLRSSHPPLVGVVAGIVLSGALVAWTLQRIGEAKTDQTEVATQRSADSERTAALAREPMLVSVVKGSADRWQPRVELDGTLAAVRDAQLGFKVGGRLLRVLVKEGDRVATGAKLAELDDTEAGAQAAAAEAQVRAAEASLSLAQDSERRTLPLVKNGTVPEATGVQASQQRQLVAAQLDGARAQHALARAALGNHVLRAPFAGTITQAPTGIGAVVSPGQPLFGLVDTTTLKLATTVSEADANLLERGAEVHLAAGTGEVSGRVSAILATLDVRTRRVPVVVEFDNARAKSSGPTLRAGAFVRGWVVARESIAVLRFPHNVQSPGSRDEVWVLGPGSLLESRQIGYAIAPNGDLLVHAGIRAEDQLVLDPIAELEAGNAVRVAAAAPTGPEAPAAPAVPAAPAAAAPAPTPSAQVRTP